MATVVLTRALAATAGTGNRLDVPGATVGDVMRGMCAEHENLTRHLLHPNGKIKGHVLLSVDGEQAGLESPIGDDDELRVLLATAGGR